MKVEIKVPAMGESISEATIGNFIKQSHSQVSADDELVELETDKVNQVLYAPKAGELTWNVSKDDVVKIGQVIGYVDTEKASQSPSSDKAKATEKETSQPALEPPQPVQAQTPKTQSLKPVPKASEHSTRTTKQEFVKELTSSPKSDKEKSVVASSSKPAQQVQKGDRSETRTKMTKIRKIISSRLVDALHQSAMLTTFNEVDMTKIIELREIYKETFFKQNNIKLGFMSFFVKAAVSAMQAYPQINAYIDGDDIVTRHYYDIGIAVSTERGLIVPVVRQCDSKSFAEIERTIEEYASKAREGGLSPDDLQGGGFTITNGGVYGSLLSTPLINPPQCAILGMHKIMKRPVVIDDQIVIRSMMYLALSYDHRIIDGKEAVSFLVHIKNCLEDPSRMLIGI